jgi:hypothetical protein
MFWPMVRVGADGDLVVVDETKTPGFTPEPVALFHDVVDGNGVTWYVAPEPNPPALYRSHPVTDDAPYGEVLKSDSLVGIQAAVLEYGADRADELRAAIADGSVVIGADGAPHRKPGTSLLEPPVVDRVPKVEPVGRASGGSEWWWGVAAIACVGGIFLVARSSAPKS